jgi:tRNA threonylcarbamoyladenosine biosynthesis protein TsaB
MQEVYWACFEKSAGGLASLVGGEHVTTPVAVQLPADWTGSATGAGRGFRIYPQLGELVGEPLSDLLPRAHEIARLATEGERLAPDQALPVYLRDDVATPPSRD